MINLLTILLTLHPFLCIFSQTIDIPTSHVINFILYPNSKVNVDFFNRSFLNMSSYTAIQGSINTSTIALYTSYTLLTSGGCSYTIYECSYYNDCPDKLAISVNVTLPFYDGSGPYISA